MLTLALALLLAAEPAPLDAPPVATSSCAAIREAWALQRDTAVKWRGIAEKRAETAAGLAAVVLVARERERCASHAKALVEAEWGCCSGAAEGVLRNILSGRVR
jgi:hypothetical protein